VPKTEERSKANKQIPALYPHPADVLITLDKLGHTIHTPTYLPTYLPTHPPNQPSFTAVIQFYLGDGRGWLQHTRQMIRDTTFSPRRFMYALVETCSSQYVALTLKKCFTTKRDACSPSGGQYGPVRRNKSGTKNTNTQKKVLSKSNHN
jgi:hypothetical protein